MRDHTAIYLAPPPKMGDFSARWPCPGGEGGGWEGKGQMGWIVGGIFTTPGHWGKGWPGGDISDGDSPAGPMGPKPPGRLRGPRRPGGPGGPPCPGGPGTPLPSEEPAPSPGGPGGGLPKGGWDAGSICGKAFVVQLSLTGGG